MKMTMTQPMDDWLVRRFEEQRPQLRALAYRMLGSLAEADDAVQDAGRGRALRPNRRSQQQTEAAEEDETHRSNQSYRSGPGPQAADR